MCVCTTLEHTVSLGMRKVDCMQLPPPDGPTDPQKAQSVVSLPNLKAVVITQDFVTTQPISLVLPDPLLYLGTDLRSEFDHGTTTSNGKVHGMIVERFSKFWTYQSRSCPLLHMTLTAKIHTADKDPISPPFGYSYSLAIRWKQFWPEDGGF
jgi:hypothetical protein